MRTVIQNLKGRPLVVMLSKRRSVCLDAFASQMFDESPAELREGSLHLEACEAAGLCKVTAISPPPMPTPPKEPEVRERVLTPLVVEDTEIPVFEIPRKRSRKEKD